MFYLHHTNDHTMNIELAISIQIGPALQSFLDHSDHFGPRNPRDIIQPTHHLDLLMNSLPHARNGMMLRLTMNALFVTYIKNNSLTTSGRKFKSDLILNQCFDGEIPALKTLRLTQGVHNEIHPQNPANNRELISIEDALNRGLISHSLNTFDVLRQDMKHFDPDHIGTASMMLMVRLNSHRVNLDPHIIEEIRNEYFIVRDTLTQWTQLLREKREGTLTAEQMGLFEDHMRGAPEIKEPVSV
jgi:hypothetical protein